MHFRGFALPCLFTFVGTYLLWASGHQVEKAVEKPKSAQRATLDGVWEHTGSVCDPKKFRTFKFVMINKGAESFWVLPLRIGSMVKPYRVTQKAGGRQDGIDFVCLDDNQTIRALFGVSSDKLTISWRGDRKTLVRPDKLTPPPEDCVLQNFKRVRFPARSPEVKADPRLAGIWETVTFESNGEITEKKDFDYSFEQKELTLYVQGDHCMMMTKANNDLKITMTRLELKTKEGDQALDIKYPDNTITPAIYSITDDRMSICWTSNGPRPDQYITAHRTLQWVRT